MSVDDLRAALHAVERGETFAWVTVLAVEGSSPGQPGQKMIVYSDGRQEGTVGGGALELKAASDSRQMLRQGRGGILKLDLDPASPNAIGAVCGGSALLSVEIFPASLHLLLCGAGHLSLALARLCRELGFAHTVVDARPEMATSERYPGAVELALEPPPLFLARGDLARFTHLIILTHKHDLDGETLQAAWKAGFGKYIGLVGSRRKWMEVRTRLTSRGVPPDWLDRVHCPIGLPISALNPAEIAVSIAAEILKERGAEGSNPAKGSTHP